MRCANHPEIDTDRRCAKCQCAACENCLVSLGGALFCAACKEERIRELKSGVAQPWAPEGIELAGFWRRLCAVYLDRWLFFPVWYLAVYVFHVVQLHREPGHTFRYLLRESALYALIAGPFWAIYEWQMLRAFGQTLGKKLFGLQVVGLSGQRLSPRQALLRAAARLFILPISLIDNMFYFGEGRRTLHDRIAKTQVILKPKLPDSRPRRR